MFTTAGVDTDSTLFNSHTNDSDNLWSLGTNNSISATGQSAVAYLWCDVPNYRNLDCMLVIILVPQMDLS